MHSLIVPIQLFPTSQRDIPFQRVLSSAEELRGKTVELGDSMERGRGKKRKRKEKDCCWPAANCLSLFSFFFVFFGKGEEIARKIFSVEN